MSSEPEDVNHAVKFLIHVTLVFVAFTLAYELRRALPLDWWLTSPVALRVIGWASLYALIAGVVEIASGTERTAWRFTSARETLVILRSVTITAGIFLLAIFVIDRGLQLPRSVLPLAWLTSFVMLVGVRLFWRVAHDRDLAWEMLLGRGAQIPAGKTPLVVVGGMRAADPHIRHLLSDTSATHWPIALLSPDAREAGARLHGLPSLRLIASSIDAQLEALGDRGRPDVLFVEDPRVDLALSVEMIGKLRTVGFILMRPQTVARVDASSNGARLEEIPVEEFLRRDPVDLDRAPIVKLVAGKRVLVTGAGGSIGSEIVRQLVDLGCAHLTLVDHAEFQLFEIDRELEGRAPSISRRPALASVRDERRMRSLFIEEKPDIVFHAAALKHVTLVEKNACEGVLTNVVGTQNVISAAMACGAAQFMLISTDKAVSPTNVMGASKRLAETLLDNAPSTAMKLSAVRFGNVLGSAGSVVPIFKNQIEKGGPVTVTDPSVERYFMTIPEAVQLVLHATAISAADSRSEPSRFLLEMGSPVRIVDLARQMILLSGKKPDVDIAIRFTGLKPGEKLSEDLLDVNEEVVFRSEGIVRVRDQAGYGSVSMDDIGALISQAQGGDEETVSSRIFNIIQATKVRKVA